MDEEIDNGPITEQEQIEAMKRFAGQKPLIEEIFGDPVVGNGFRGDTAAQEPQ